MPSIERLPEAERADLIARLKRIEGQAKGIQKMIEEGRDCVAVLDQLASIKAGTNVLGTEALEAFALYCFRHPEDFSSPDVAVAEAVRALVRAGR